MVSFPIEVTYTDENRPEWIIVNKENMENPFSLTIRIKSWNEIELIEDNIEALLLDLQNAVTYSGMTVQDAYALIGFIRFTANKVVFTIDGTGTDVFEIILPPGVTAVDVRKPDGTKIPFVFNEARNSVCFMVTFSSVETIEILVGSITNLLNRAVSSIVSVSLLSYVVANIISSISEVVKEVREKT